MRSRRWSRTERKADRYAGGHRGGKGCQPEHARRDGLLTEVLQVDFQSNEKHQEHAAEFREEDGYLTGLGGDAKHVRAHQHAAQHQAQDAGEPHPFDQGRENDQHKQRNSEAVERMSLAEKLQDHPRLPVLDEGDRRDDYRENDKRATDCEAFHRGWRIALLWPRCASDFNEDPLSDNARPPPIMRPDFMERVYEKIWCLFRSKHHGYPRSDRSDPRTLRRWQGVTFRDFRVSLSSLFPAKAVGSEQSAIAGELVLRIAAVFLAYFIAGKLGQATTNIRSSNLGPVWPAYGIALAAFLAYGYRVWPGIAASAFLVAFSSAVPPLAAAGQAIGATVAALTGALLLRRIPDFDPSLSRLSDALGLVVLGAFGSSIISASIGVFSLYATGVQAYSGPGLGLADLLARRQHRRAAGHAARVYAAESLSDSVSGTDR